MPKFNTTFPVAIYKKFTLDPLIGANEEVLRPAYKVPWAFSVRSETGSDIIFFITKRNGQVVLCTFPRPDNILGTKVGETSMDYGMVFNDLEKSLRACTVETKLNLAAFWRCYLSSIVIHSDEIPDKVFEVSSFISVTKRSDICSII